LNFLGFSSWVSLNGIQLRTSVSMGAAAGSDFLGEVGILHGHQMNGPILTIQASSGKFLRGLENLRPLFLPTLRRIEELYLSRTHLRAYVLTFVPFFVLPKPSQTLSTPLALNDFW
jgi:hypothetical protein